MNYFYIDANGQKQGPVSEQRLKELATQGSIEPNTPLETTTGYKDVAGRIGIKFDFRKVSQDDQTPEQAKYSSPRRSKHAHVGESANTSESPGIFDIGFTRFISNTWISIIWVMLITAHFLAAIGATICSFYVGDPVPFLIALFAVPISLLFSRMALELEVIFFRIETNTRESKEHLREIKELLAQK